MRSGWPAAAFVLTCAAIAGCGGGQDTADPTAPARAAADRATVGCAQGGTSTAARSPTWGPTSVVSGPLTLGYVWQYADQPPTAFASTRERLRRLAVAAPTARERRLARRARAHAAPGSYAVHEVMVQVAAGEQATLSVAPRQRSSVALVYTRRARNAERRGAPGAYRVADADPAVTFRACPQRATYFLGGVVVAGPRCVQLTVSGSGQRRPASLRLPFGPDSCTERPRGTRVLSREPYLGVACPAANSIACDRVGLAVWLKRPAARVTATINGRALPLPAGQPDGRGAWYRGYLQPAGLLDGRLKVTPDRGRHFWQGTHPRDAQLRIAIRRSDGTTDRVSLTVPLRAGWG